MDNVFQDLRFSLRMLVKNPGVTAVAIISLALGIGANTAIFSVVSGVLLKSLPYHDPERLVLVWGHDRAEGSDRDQVSATDVADFRRENSVFEDITTYGGWSAVIAETGDPERMQGMQVGDGYFEIMRGVPLLGRVFLPEEQEPGKDFVVILSYGLWQRKFGGDPDVVGRKVDMSGMPYTVVGVMPEDFESLPTSLVTVPAQLYRPVAEPHDETQRSARHLRAIARLKPGVEVEQAQAEMTAIARRIEETHPDSNHEYGLRVVSITEDTVGGIRQALLLLTGAVGFVLLIACANVANLMLARATSRQKETAIRAALGAARRRLVRQFLTESVLLAVAGGGLGLLAAMWGLSLIESFGNKVTPLLSGIEIDGRVLAFTLGLSLLTGVLFGLAPALHASKPDLNESLKEGGRNAGAGAGHGRLRNLLVVVQVAMALVLLVSAGLLIRSVIRLSNVDPGFDTSNLLTMNVWLPQAKYPEDLKWIAFYDQLVERVDALPGVKSSGLVSVLPLSSNFDGRGLEVEGQPKPPGQGPEADLYIVTPGYLRAMGIALRSGRFITEQDRRDGFPVALVNETMARTLWPGEDAIGKRIRLSGGRERPWRTVVGVMADVKQYGLDRPSPMQFYLPETQLASSFLTLVVRTHTDPASLSSAVRREINSLDPQLAAFNIATMDELRAGSMSLRRFSMLLLGLFAALALVLAAVGIYGVISYSVTQRTHEIGIRVALGAGSSDVLRLVVGQGMMLALSGVGIGLAGALLLTRVMESLLYGVSATDLVTYVVISVILAMVAMVASYIPARRATKVDPMTALRYE